MTVFTENFDRSDVSGNAPDDLSLGQNIWRIIHPDTGVVSNRFSNTTGTGSISAGATLSTGTGDHTVTVTVATVTAAPTTLETSRIWVSVGVPDADYFSGGGWNLLVDGSFGDGLWRYRLDLATTDNNYYSLNDLTTSFMVGSALTAGDSLAIVTSGQATATTVTLKQNGVTLATFGQAELLAAGVTDFSLLPNGTFTALETFSTASGQNTLDDFSDTVTPWPPGPVDHKLPALSSDVPYLQANDRYQVLACVNRGDSTHPPEFRYWYAGAPSWDESV